MDLEQYYDSIDLNKIKQFVELGKEEDLFLEFKRTAHPYINDHNKNDDKKNLSKCLSGFANSSGGIVIWGVTAEQNKDKIDCARKLSPIKELMRFLNWLNSLEGQAVVPTLVGVRHEAIQEEEEMGYIKTFIPPSNSAPHMALYADKHYYKRSGDSFYMAEHFDIVDMFTRKKKPLLELKLINLTKQRVSDDIQIELTIAIKNTSQVIGKFPYLAISVNEGNFSISRSGPQGNPLSGFKRVRNDRTYQANFIGGNDVVIFPGTIYEVEKITGGFRLPIPLEFSPEIVIDYLLTCENMELKKDRIVFSISGLLSGNLIIKKN